MTPIRGISALPGPVARTFHALFMRTLKLNIMRFDKLKRHSVYVIPAGSYFGKDDDACYMVYSPLANLFYLSLPKDVEEMEKQFEDGETSELLGRLLDTSAYNKDEVEVSSDTFCTLHLLLNEKCNFTCKYCYSAKGRSSAEVTMKQIHTVLDHFLSAQRKAVKERTVMFMGGGEPLLSWSLLEQATEYAEKVAKEQGINLHLSLTTNGSLLSDEMIAWLKEHNFTVQISFEILPDVQREQRGNYESVEKNLISLTEAGVNNYVRSTITESNVDRIPEMVEYCHNHFPKVRKMSCQQVVDPTYFTDIKVVDEFFNRYFVSYKKGTELAAQYGIDLRSSSSHLLNYSKRERFCYNLLCLTPYGTLTMCPDVSSPKEDDYLDSLIGKVGDEGVIFDEQAFARLSHGTIHTIDKCRDCYAKWNCGSGCPSSRRVYTPEIFDAICGYYRRMLLDSLMNALAEKYAKATGKDFFEDIASKL